MAVLFPSAYIRWREPLCVWSHLVHKLAQTAVTLVPPVGTIFSPTYNPTVALLESSSLAQIHMLSFGMKLRFGTHLAAGAFHFATAVAANEQICAAGFPFIPGAGSAAGRSRGRGSSTSRGSSSRGRRNASGLRRAAISSPGAALRRILCPDAARDPCALPLAAGAACNALMTVWQAVACYGLPCALVYASGAAAVH
jgi:hypothetical protein